MPNRSLLLIAFAFMMACDAGGDVSATAEITVGGQPFPAESVDAMLIRVTTETHQLCMWTVIAESADKTFSLELERFIDAPITWNAESEETADTYASGFGASYGAYELVEANITTTREDDALIANFSLTFEAADSVSASGTVRWDGLSEAQNTPGCP